MILGGKIKFYMWGCCLLVEDTQPFLLHRCRGDFSPHYGAVSPFLLHRCRGLVLPVKGRQAPFGWLKFPHTKRISHYYNKYQSRKTPQNPPHPNKKATIRSLSFLSLGYLMIILLSLFDNGKFADFNHCPGVGYLFIIYRNSAAGDVCSRLSL